MAGLCRGIVGNADMMLGAAAVDELLAAHAAAAPARFRGIRYITASDSDMNIPARFMAKPGVMRDPDFLAAFERLAARDLVFDAFLPHPQLSEVAALARAFPETRIVINHTGGPMAIGRYACTAAARFEEWRDGLAACAAYPHVRLKLGGLQMWFTGLGWSDLSRPPTSADIAESQAGHILTAIEIFGPDRCMFESNFPVDMIHVGGTVLWNAFKRITAGLDRAARADLFAGTAARAYRIEI
jgi:predicted TIM-barrel fold metal-dependent hydrolase